MDDSTTAKRTRTEQCKINAQARSEKKRQAAFEALSRLKREQRAITKAAVARRAGVSVVFLRKHPDLVQAIEEAEHTLLTSPSPVARADQAKDQVIAALRRRLDEMKQTMAAKDAELREKQREIDQLYGKLAAASPLTDPELRHVLAKTQEGPRCAEEPHSLQEVSKPRQASPAKERTTGLLPKRFVSLLAFARLHNIAESTVQTHAGMGLLPAKHGEWTDTDGPMVTLALDAKGNAAFYQLYREFPMFLACKLCPHGYLDLPRQSRENAQM